MKHILALSLAVTLVLLSAAVYAASITITLAPGTNATSHRIEKKVGAGSYAPLVTLPMPTVSYVDTAVAVGSTYSYRAIGINGMGESAPSAECFSALLSVGPPSLNCVINP